jgi:hypothetical protein
MWGIEGQLAKFAMTLVVAPNSPLAWAVVTTLP